MLTCSALTKGCGRWISNCSEMSSLSNESSSPTAKSGEPPGIGSGTSPVSVRAHRELPHAVCMHGRAERTSEVVLEGMLVEEGLRHREVISQESLVRRMFRGRDANRYVAREKQ